jgi:hypothetical protein
MTKKIHSFVVLIALWAVACGDLAPEASTPQTDRGKEGGKERGLDESPSTEGGSIDTGTRTTPQPDAMPVTACVDPTVGATCSGASTPCQPANPCATGYIWSCSYDNVGAAWVREGITCSSQPNGTTRPTSACPDGEVVFVDERPHDGCILPAADAGACPTGLYLSRIRPPCCSYPSQAWCVPTPAACHDEVSCDCVESVCASQCGSYPGVCASAFGSVVDCVCGN